jgi:penicillin amidase
MGLTRKLCSAAALVTALATAGCGDDDDDVRRPLDTLLEVQETERWRLEGLSAPVYVVRTEANIPHLYGYNQRDLGFVLGFVTARDRYFMMDLSRRLASGTLAEVLGDATLDIDLESRGTGMSHVAQQIHDNLTPEMEAYFDAYAAGVNAYIEAVRADELPAPSELGLAQGILGVSSPLELMRPFDRYSVAAMVAVVVYDASYEDGDVGRALTATLLDQLFVDAPALQAERRAGARIDLWGQFAPVKDVASSPGFATEITTRNGKLSAPRRARAGAHQKVPTSLLQRLNGRLEQQQKRLRRDREVGYGSNAWAVNAWANPNGTAILAGDGHLPLSVPSILYQVGLDTSVLGGGDVHQLGLTVPGFPIMAIGTNGKVAWSQTQLMGDITDWYAEQLQLDNQGRPARALFQGQWRVLKRTDERYEIANVPLLDSEGRTEIWPRWETFDGRWLADIEGRKYDPDEPLAPGEAVVSMQGDLIVPGDTNNDGEVTGISFDYAGFDAGGTLAAVDRFGKANDVYEFREAARALVSFSQNFAVADHKGNIFYTSYQAVPCRSYLDRESNGDFIDGADPNMLLDGTRYGGFEIPTIDGVVDEEPGKELARACVVPFDEMPQVVNPDSGFVSTANNDPGGISFDNSIYNDKWYIGGPWASGFRADTISRELTKAVKAGDATVERMAEIQGNVQSPLGQLLMQQFLGTIDYARDLGSPTSEADLKVAELYATEKGDIDKVYERLTEWAAKGYQARSGVQTYYNLPDDQELRDSVATTLFNSWMGHTMSLVFADEQLPGVWRPSGSHGQVRALDMFLRGRGDDNPLELASWVATTKESAFFDILDTAPIESSHWVLLQALHDTLNHMRSDPNDDFTGGFGTRDMSRWRWGMRHYVRFEALLDDFVNADEYGSITERFEINTAQIPLDKGVTPGDELFGLNWFPRDGDQFCVDAANSGMNGKTFSYSSGPVMRMVIALDEGVVTGHNIIPGGQSAIVESEHFADQARLWLANETLPMRFSFESVLAAASGRESYLPQ